MFSFVGANRILEGLVEGGVLSLDWLFLMLVHLIGLLQQGGLLVVEMIYGGYEHQYMLLCGGRFCQFYDRCKWAGWYGNLLQ